MRMLRIAAVLCVFSIFALPAHSQDNAPDHVITGNDLTDACQLAISARNNPYQVLTASDAGKIGYCLGTAYGVMATLKANNLICEPGDVTTDQSVRVVEKFLQDHPTKLNQPAALLAMQALEEAFPCK